MKNRGMAKIDEFLKLRAISKFNIMSRIYCIKEKKKQKNKRHRSNICGIIKTQFLKENKEGKLISIKQCFLYYQKKGIF